ncbi:MAG: hypothetical protein Tsb009_13390 [Planctomycetaceae bacterium]
MGTYDVSLGQVDVTDLRTDGELRSEAKRLLPLALRQIGEAAALDAWEKLQSCGVDLELSMSGSETEKRKFIEQAGLKYQQQAELSERQQVENHIYEQLQALKAAS